MIARKWIINYQPLEYLSTEADELNCERAIFNEIKDIELLPTFDGLAYIVDVRIFGRKVEVNVKLSEQLTLENVDIFKAIIKDDVTDYLLDYINKYREYYEN